jgi:hypothetical protein
MKGELALPAFQMDCRDWLVIRPDETGLPDEVAGTPLLAVLSTAVLDARDFRSVSAVLTIGLLDDDCAEQGWLGWPPDEVDPLDDEGSARYLLPAPDGRLALLAEFTVTGTVDAEVHRRVDALMASFRWAA